MRLGFADVLGARTLGALPGLERHGLPLTERVERLARRLMEEVLLARLVGHEAEALFRDDALDGAALPGGVAPLEEHADLQLLTAHPFLQLHQLALEVLHLLVVRLVGELRRVLFLRLVRVLVVGHP
mgnify:CR=1 FL=1